MSSEWPLWSKHCANRTVYNNMHCFPRFLPAFLKWTNLTAYIEHCNLNFFKGWRSLTHPLTFNCLPACRYPYYISGAQRQASCECFFPVCMIQVSAASQISHCLPVWQANRSSDAAPADLCVCLPAWLPECVCVFVCVYASALGE